MQPLTWELVNRLIEERGLTPPLDREYADDELKNIVTRLNEIRAEESKLIQHIKEKALNNR